MSFLRRNTTKLTTVDEEVRTEKKDVSEMMLAPLRRDSLNDDKKSKQPLDEKEMEAMKCQYDCLSIIDDIITAKMKQRPNKEIQLYDALIKECYDYHKHDPNPQDPGIKKAAIIELIQKHADRASKPKGKKSATMTSFTSDMAVIIKGEIYKKKGKGSYKAKRDSVTIQEAQAKAERMFDVKKVGTKREEDSSEESSLGESGEAFGPTTKK